MRCGATPISAIRVATVRRMSWTTQWALMPVSSSSAASLAPNY